ncbi:MAG: sugar ABC transporter permease [Phycisphaerae bacterium]
MIWSWLLNPRFGLVNAALRLFYRLLDPVVGLFHETGTSLWVTPDWFYSPSSCKPALIIMHLWLGGGTMLVFLAALQRVPARLIEAAAIDGAGRWQRFRHVTLPHISPAILFNLIVGLVFSMQSFDQSYLLFNRAQRDGLLFYMLHLYRIAFESPYRVGYASALAWVLFGTTALVVAVVLLVSRRRVYYAVNR